MTPQCVEANDWFITPGRGMNNTVMTGSWGRIPVSNKRRGRRAGGGGGGQEEDERGGETNSQSESEEAKSPSGFVRSESSVVMFLQKAKYAKRIYASIVHSQFDCCGDRKAGYIVPLEYPLTGFLNRFYQRCGIDPSLISYLEADGSGIKNLPFVRMFPWDLFALADYLCIPSEVLINLGYAMEPYEIRVVGTEFKLGLRFWGGVARQGFLAQIAARQEERLATPALGTSS
uniref:Uncharacterized protein n=1 Tax=Timema poppense TaxID=170557 RepID=A0A7R9DD05_TIMPO|nr:unnamed protein product [Timema poppensis]